jgi:hypothetical protein
VRVRRDDELGRLGRLGKLGKLGGFRKLGEHLR